MERVWIDKEDGKKRPIGKPTFEDKIVQRAVAMLLGAVYEQDFYDFSHGFRPNRNAHQALQLLKEQCVKMEVGWIVDADVSGFFDNLDHGLLRDIMERRVNDGGITRFIGKWLNAGVLEDGALKHSDKGTPQGGVISPMLSNIFLHHVLDDWFVRVVKPRLKGKCFLIRFADDFVVGCTREEDARWVLTALKERFEGFKLAIHPEKTRLVRFRRPSPQAENGSGDSQLYPKLRGHYQYYGVRFNDRMLDLASDHVKFALRLWLKRQCHKDMGATADSTRMQGRPAK